MSDTAVSLQEAYYGSEHFKIGDIVYYVSEYEDRKNYSKIQGIIIEKNVTKIYGSWKEDIRDVRSEFLREFDPLKPNFSFMPIDRVFKYEEGVVITGVDWCRGKDKSVKTVWYEPLIEVVGDIKTKGENKMNETIAKLFEKTANAMVVDKWFSGQIANNEVTYILLKGHEKELLEAAQKLEQESLKK